MEKKNENKLVVSMSKVIEIFSTKNRIDVTDEKLITDILPEGYDFGKIA